MTVVNVDTALICLNLEARESERSVALNGIVQHLLLMYKLVLHIHECSYQNTTTIIGFNCMVFLYI